MSKFKVSVHRWITGILASAMVFTALPVNVFGEEVEVLEDEQVVVVEESEEVVDADSDDFLENDDEVSVTTLINTFDYRSEEAMALATVTIDGLDEDDKTTSEAVYYTVDPYEGMKVVSVSYQIGETTPEKLVFNEGRYEIPANAIATAIDQGMDITVAIVVEEAAERIYETKLGLNKKTTSFLRGEGTVYEIDPEDPDTYKNTYKNTLLLATLKFSSKTTVRELDHVEMFYPNGEEVLGLDNMLLVVGDEIRLYRSDWLDMVGQYTLKVYPKMPVDRATESKPAVMNFTVKRSIEDVRVEAPGYYEWDNIFIVRYKEPNKSLTIKPTVVYNYSKLGYFAPTIKKVTWELLDEEYNPLKSDKITINKSNGTVTIASDYTVNKVFFIKAKAADYETNPVYGLLEVDLVTTKTKIGSIKIGDVTDFDQEVYRSDLLGKAVVVLDDIGKEIDPEDISITSNDSKNFLIKDFYDFDEDETIYNGVKEINKPGKYTLTVTAKDGSCSFKQVIKVKAPTNESYVLETNAIYDNNLNGKQIDFENNTATLNVFPTKLKIVSFSNDKNVFSNKASISVKGAKKLSSGSESVDQKYIWIKPTSNKITITHKYGKGKDAKNETYTINLNHSKIKAGVTKKTYEIWADAEEQEYPFEFSVTGIDNENAGEYYLRANYNPKSNNNIIDLAHYLNSSAPVNLAAGSEKFTINAYIGEYGYEPIPKGNYNLSVALYKLTGVNDDGNNEYTAVSDPFDITIKAIKAKAPSATINVTDKKPLVVEKEKDQSAIIGFKTLKNVKGIDTASVKAYCNNKDGSVNRFTQFFEVYPVMINNGEISEPAPDSLSDGLQLVVKETEGIDESKDMTGWVKYTIVGEDITQKVEKIEKITVKFK